MISFTTFKGFVYTLKKDMSITNGQTATLLKAGTVVHYQSLSNGVYFYAQA